MDRILVRSWLHAALAVGFMTETAPARPQEQLPSVAAGYGQGLGLVAAGVPGLQDFGKRGGTLLADAGWWLDPHWMVGVYGECGPFSAGNVGLGVGWRGYWADLAEGSYRLQASTWCGSRSASPAA